MAPAPYEQKQDHFTKLKQLLALEAKAEQDRYRQSLEDRSDVLRAEQSGHSLRLLSMVDEAGGLGGRIVIVFRKSSLAPLPWTRLDAGSPVFCSPDPGDGRRLLRGVVVERRERVIHVVFDEPPEWDDGEQYRLDLAFDEIARKREREALDTVAKAKGDRLANLRSVLLGLSSPKQRREQPEQAFNRDLNSEQWAAVVKAYQAEDLAIIHGPPGTGKTTTLVELIRQEILRGSKVLVTAPSNLGVDHVLEKLLASGETVVRMGHPARIMPQLLGQSLDAQVERHDDARLARKMMKEASLLFQQARRYTRTAPTRGSRQALLAEARSLMADARTLEARAVTRVLDGAPVIGATATGLDPFLLGPRRFDLVVIDEAGQATEPTAWIPTLRANKLVLGGDHCQLPPTILSAEAEAQGYGISMMERLVGLYGSEITSCLEVQYRMHEAIMGFPSLMFYQSRLKAAPRVAHHSLADILPLTAEEAPLLFIDTAGAGFYEEAETDGGGLLNPKEGELILCRARKLLDLGIAPTALALITPYAAQARWLRDHCEMMDIEVDTIDGFQGREKEVVLLSLVRCNDQQSLGFLRETRRLNVALTRARRQLIIVGDSGTLASHAFFQSLLEYMERQSAYRTVWTEEPQLIDS